MSRKNHKNKYEAVPEGVRKYITTELNPSTSSWERFGLRKEPDGTAVLVTDFTINVPQEIREQMNEAAGEMLREHFVKFLSGLSRGAAPKAAKKAALKTFPGGAMVLAVNDETAGAVTAFLGAFPAEAEAEPGFHAMLLEFLVAAA